MRITPVLTNQELAMYYQQMQGHLINIAFRYLVDECHVDLDDFKSVDMYGRIGGFKVIYIDKHMDIYDVNFTKDLELL